MSYVDGTDLKSILKWDGAMSVGRAVLVSRSARRSRRRTGGVVHRDLKPQNILIDREGHAFIADFGISRSIDSGGTLTEVGKVLGTVDYMAPEQALGERSDHRADIYSFGVILFEIFTGTLPFGGGDAMSVMMKRLHEEPQPIRRIRRQVPAWLSEIVARALRRDPADRYQSIADLLRDLEHHHASHSWRRIRRRVLLPAVASGHRGGDRRRGAHLEGAGRRCRPVRQPPGHSPVPEHTGDPRYDWARDGPPSLRDGLVQTKNLRLVGDERVQDVLGTLRAPKGEESRPATMRKIATLIGADHVLAGRLLKIADRLRIEARLQQAGSQDTSGPPLLVDGAGEQAIPAMLDDLTQRVRESLGISRGWLERARGATEPTTHSAEALALHGQGVALVRAGQYLEASKRLEEAVQKDPDFSMARALLAETYDELGSSEKASDEAKKAAASLGSASPYEAARVRATLASMGGDLPAAEKAYASLCEITPNDAAAFFELASIREARGNLPGALDAFRRVVALDPKHPSAHFPGESCPRSAIRRRRLRAERRPGP